DERSARRRRERLRRDARREPETPAAPALVARLRAREWLPAIYFRFGRRSAEELAWSVVESGALLPRSETRRRAIEDAIARMLLDMDADTRGLQQVTDLVRILPNGHAYLL